MKSILVPTNYSSFNKENISQLQFALTRLGYIISGSEIEDGYIGCNTKEAIYNFKKSHNLQGAWEVTAELISAINDEISSHYRIIGELVDILGTPAVGYTIIVKQQFFNDFENKEIGRGATRSDGSFCILFNKPNEIYSTKIDAFCVYLEIQDSSLGIVSFFKDTNLANNSPQKDLISFTTNEVFVKYYLHTILFPDLTKNPLYKAVLAFEYIYIANHKITSTSDVINLTIYPSEFDKLSKLSGSSSNDLMKLYLTLKSILRCSYYDNNIGYSV